ncbi:hypothetical protein A6769_31805 [Nostoc punctiforme NIES-2108]|uniref:Uncharacterized protein n=1 Tax=Nostoc punctiforme NIES-2108 TaxID=1356359 RepID=A0A367R3K1_NOSPU|nr:hypothetical protein A6769_31805 [Nostoc punctiforme NIES-2108]
MHLISFFPPAYPPHKTALLPCKFSQVASGWGMPEQYHWKLENPREITPIPYIGRLGIFEVPDDLVMEAIAL